MGSFMTLDDIHDIHCIETNLLKHAILMLRA